MQEPLNRTPRRGLAAIEAALFLPLLFLIVFGMVEYGWAFLKFECINNAAREGVRAAVRDGATDATWQAAVDNVMKDAGKTPGVPPPSTTRTLTPGVGSPKGTQLTCTVTVNYSDLNLMNVTLFPVPSTLTATATMAKEGP
jgi:Flp pilus assembly protein TadG